MTDLLPILQRLGLPQYHDAFVSEGFDSWETVLDIQESDLDSLGVRLGHRRKLQRAIAEYRGLPLSKPLGTDARQTPVPEPGRADNSPQQQAFPKDSQLAGQAEQKRKYRRHPKPDENAPEKPPSGYVLFSNSIREEVKSENLSFTDIAKLAGDRWQKLEPAQKDLYENHAAQLKDAYNAQLAEYKKTDSFREYTRYLQQFKVKHETAADAKKPRLEHYASSSLSTASDGNLSESSHQAQGHYRGDSLISAGTISGQAAQLPLHLSTVLPSLQGISAARPSPTLRQLHRPGLVQTSTQSSLSDESPGARTDADTLQRTANLSLANPVSGTPPPSLSGRHDRPEHGQNLSHLSQGWPIWNQGQLKTVIESSELSPHSDGNMRTSRDLMPDVRSGMASIDGSALHSGLASQSVPSLPTSYSSATDHSSAASRRILPPLLRQSPSNPSHLPFPAFGSPTAPGPSHYPQQVNDHLAFRQGSWSEPNKSESEAASTLTALADRRQSLPQHMPSPADMSTNR